MEISIPNGVSITPALFCAVSVSSSIRQLLENRQLKTTSTHDNSVVDAKWGHLGTPSRSLFVVRNSARNELTTVGFFGLSVWEYFSIKHINLEKQEHTRARFFCESRRYKYRSPPKGQHVCGLGSIPFAADSATYCYSAYWWHTITANKLLHRRPSLA